MFGTELVKIVSYPVLTDKVLANIFLEIRRAPQLPLSPHRLKRRSLANCKIDPKMEAWLAA